jgi:hypothetical protein
VSLSPKRRLKFRTASFLIWRFCGKQTALLWLTRSSSFGFENKSVYSDYKQDIKNVDFPAVAARPGMVPDWDNHRLWHGPECNLQARRPDSGGQHPHESTYSYYRRCLRHVRPGHVRTKSLVGVTFQTDYRRLLKAIVCDPQDLDCADDVTRQLVIADAFAANVVVELAKLEAVMCSDRLSVTPTTANSTTCPYPPVVSPAYTEGRRRHLTSSIVPDVLGGVLRVDQRGKYPRVRLTFLSFLFRLTATLLCFLFFLLLTITSSL